MGKTTIGSLLNKPFRALLALSLCVGLCPSPALALDEGQEPLAPTDEVTATADIDAGNGLVTETIDNGLGFGSIDSSWSAGRISTLSATAQSNSELAFGLIADAYDEGKTDVNIDEYGIAVDDFDTAVARAQVDPSFYYAGQQISYSYFTSTNTIHEFHLTYLFDASELASVKQAFEEQASIALSWITDDMSDLLKVQALHDFLVRNVEYDTPASLTGDYSTAHTAYGALVDKKAVCQGYSMAYKLLLTRAGIPCIYVTSEAMNHGWNMVMLDGQWYHVDCTWDDPTPDRGFDANVLHTHFLRSDASMKTLGYHDWTAEQTADADWPAYDMPTFNAPLRPTPGTNPQVKYVPAPVGKTLSYNGAEQVGVTPDERYTLTGNTATEPGDYTATASLVDKEHCVWANTGTSDDIEISWSITAVEADRTWPADDIARPFKLSVPTTDEVTWALSNPSVARLENVSSTPATVNSTAGQIAQVDFVPVQAGFTELNAYVGTQRVWTCRIKVTAQSTPKTDIGKATVSGLDEPFPYTGSAIEPKPVVSLAGKTLTEGTDYTLSYAGNLVPGEAMVTITGIGDYEGSVEKMFTIKATLERLAGDDAAATAAAIAQAAFPEGSEWVIVARDDDFADAMSATGLAGTLNAPVVLTDRYALSSATAGVVKALGAKKAYVIGGKGAIPADLESQMAEVGCQVAGRVFGNDSWDTSVACAEKIAEHGGNPDGDAIVAMSTNFQDALSISSFAYKYQVPIFLETDADNGRVLPEAARDAIGGLSGTIYVPGGPGAVPTASVEGVFGTGRVQRIYGEEGYDTSNQIAIYMVEHGLLSASTVCVASGAPDPKGVDALAGAALAGRAGGVMLLANDNAGFGVTSFTTIEGADSQNAKAFLSAHANEVGAAYLLGGKAVVGSTLQQKVTDLVG